jgi:UDP-N-acetylglucosamine diphosphorylase / glucose-1-phosphate thymidylyltransferase / UDP-N-acetylgalactosamine diphosphorylase / glucosamine-1-phosphate N-acetyltransferase / galactosamine-1-phosphate N-acetyltransferase
MPITLFEDTQTSQLDPVCLGKPAFAICCGGFRLVDLLAELGQPVATRVRPHLRELVAADFSSASSPASKSEPGQPALWVNARVVPSVAALAQLQAIVREGRPCVVREGDAVAAALVPADKQLTSVADSLPTDQDFSRLGLPSAAIGLPVFEYPHDIVRHHLTIFAENLSHRLALCSYRHLGGGVFAAGEVSLGQHVVSDTRHGPIVLEAGASVGPLANLVGPLWVGPGARVLEHASLKDGVSIGQASKVGGEVEASIIEPYTNKQHYGFLGHSYLGSWINLGAGTANSDLKNTYGLVQMEYSGQKVSTGMQFMGTVIGDYAKTAINTSIFTGKTIGAGSMVYGYATTNVPSFVNYARSFGQSTLAPAEMVVLVQQRMFERRGRAQRALDIQLLRDMFALSQPERDAFGEFSDRPLAL